MEEEFIEYIRKWNNNNLDRQIKALLKVRKYIEDPLLPSDDQNRIRRECLDYWGMQLAVLLCYS